MLLIRSCSTSLSKSFSILSPAYFVLTFPQFCTIREFHHLTTYSFFQTTDTMHKFNKTGANNDSYGFPLFTALQTNLLQFTRLLCFPYPRSCFFSFLIKESISPYAVLIHPTDQSFVLYRFKSFAKILVNHVYRLPCQHLWLLSQNILY